MSRLRDTVPTAAAKKIPLFNRRGALHFAERRLQKFEASAHRDDQELARIVRSLSIASIDDYIHLVKSLREPGSATPPHRPSGKRTVTDQRLNFLRALQCELGRKPRTGDIERAAGKSPGRAAEASKRRELMKLLPALGDGENSG